MFGRQESPIRPRKREEPFGTWDGHQKAARRFLVILLETQRVAAFDG